jgi:hypothetical protein
MVKKILREENKLTAHTSNAKQPLSYAYDF